MKRILSLMLALTMVLSILVIGTGTAKAEGSTVAEAIKAAEGMTAAELEAAAQKELADNPTLTFNADSLTSGVKKALAKFEEKYPFAAGRVAYNSKKGSEYQPKLVAAQKAGKYIADFVMIQDASFLKNAMLDTGFLLSYVPQGEEYNIAESDQNPLVGVTFNKIFMYDNTKVGQLMARITTDLFDIAEFSHHCPEEFFIFGIKIAVSFQSARYASWSRNRTSFS